MKTDKKKSDKLSDKLIQPIQGIKHRIMNTEWYLVIAKVIKERGFFGFLHDFTLILLEELFKGIRAAVTNAYVQIKEVVNDPQRQLQRLAERLRRVSLAQKLLWVGLLLLFMMTLFTVRYSLSGGASFKRAMRHLDQEDYQTALGEFTRAIERNPHYAEAYLELGKLYHHRVKNYFKAIMYYQKYLKLDDAYEDPQPVLALIKDAKERLRSTVSMKRFKSSESAFHYKLGIVKANEGDYDAAISEFLHAVELDSGNADAYQYLGDIYREQKNDIAGAQKYYKKYLEISLNVDDLDDIDPSSPFFETQYSIRAGADDEAMMYYNYGVIYAQRGEFERAIAEFRKSLEKKPKNAHAHYSIGLIYQDYGRLDKAMEEYRIALDIEPDFAEAQYGLGIIYHQKGLYQKASAAYQKALEIAPQMRSVRNNLGVLYDLLKMEDKAIGQYKTLIEMHPQYAEPYNNLGSIYGRKGLYEEAIEMFTKAIELKPDYADAYYNLGLTQSILEKNDKAIDNLYKAVVLNTNLSEAIDQLKIVCERTGVDYKRLIPIQPAAETASLPDVHKEKKLEEDYIKKIEGDSPSARAYFDLGALYEKKGYYDKAVKNYARSIEIDPQFIPSRYNRARVYKVQGQYREAIDEFYKILEIDPAYVDAHLGLGLIYVDQLNPLRDVHKGLEHYKSYLEAKSEG